MRGGLAGGERRQGGGSPRSANALLQSRALGAEAASQPGRQAAAAQVARPTNPQLASAAAAGAAPGSTRSPHYTQQRCRQVASKAQHAQHAQRAQHAQQAHPAPALWPPLLAPAAPGLPAPDRPRSALCLSPRGWRRGAPAGRGGRAGTHTHLFGMGVVSCYPRSAAGGTSRLRGVLWVLGDTIVCLFFLLLLFVGAEGCCCPRGAAGGHSPWEWRWRRE